MKTKTKSAESCSVCSNADIGEIDNTKVALGCLMPGSTGIEVVKMFVAPVLQSFTDIKSREVRRATYANKIKVKKD